MICAGLQCLAGISAGAMCNSPVAADPPHHRNAVRHWRSKHRRIPLRDLIFADKANERFIELLDIYNTACVCVNASCKTVAYTRLSEHSEAEQLTAMEKFFAAHAQKAHGVTSSAAASSAAARLFTRHSCAEFLAQAAKDVLPIYDERIIDASLSAPKKKKKVWVKKGEKMPRNTTGSTKDDKRATKPTAGRISPPLDSAVRGYKCGIQNCLKAGAPNIFSLLFYR